MSTELTTTERERFEELNGIVQRGLATFVEVGRALIEIREGRLYRANWPTFEAYLSDQHGVSRRQGYRLIEAARVVDDLCPIGHMPSNESQARELGKVKPERRAEVWQEVVAKSEATGEAVTAARIRAMAEQRNQPGEQYPFKSGRLTPLESRIRNYLGIFRDACQSLAEFGADWRPQNRLGRSALPSELIPHITAKRGLPLAGEVLLMVRCDVGRTIQYWHDVRAIDDIYLGRNDAGPESRAAYLDDEHFGIWPLAC